MKWTLRHYYAFPPGTAPKGGSLLSPSAWDQVRTAAPSETNKDFSFPQSRADWVKLAEASEDARASAATVASLVKRGGYTSILSVGVGRALLEYHLKRSLPQVPLTCTEYAPASVTRLREFFAECDSVEFLDLLAPWQAKDAKCLILLNRVDTELSDEQWSIAFGRMAEAGVSEIIVVATGFLTPRTFGSEMATRLRCRLRGQTPTFAGYLRTRARFRELWQANYVIAEEMAIGPRGGFWLRRRA